MLGMVNQLLRHIIARIMSLPSLFRSGVIKLPFSLNNRSTGALVAGIAK
jgi:hypothetical protein